MKSILVSAILTSLLFSVWEIPLSFAEIVFFIFFCLALLLFLLDVVLFKLATSLTKQGEILLEKLSKDNKGRNLQSLFRSGILISPLVIYQSSPILYMFAALAFVLTGLVYFSYLGNNYAKELTDLEDSL